jgi:hypothetical protein
VAWDHVAEVRGQQRALVNTVVNARVPYKARNILMNSQVSHDHYLHVVGKVARLVRERSIVAASKHIQVC